MNKIAAQIISNTSSPPRIRRPGELCYDEESKKAGYDILTADLDYRFVSPDSFAEYEYLQTVESKEYGGNKYGAPLDLFLDVIDAIRNRDPNTNKIDIVFAFGSSGSGKSTIRRIINSGPNNLERDIIFQAILPGSIPDILDGINKYKKRLNIEITPKILFVRSSIETISSRINNRGDTDEELNKRISSAREENTRYSKIARLLINSGVPCSIIDNDGTEDDLMNSFYSEYNEMADKPMDQTLCKIRSITKKYALPRISSPNPI